MPRGGELPSPPGTFWLDYFGANRPGPAAVRQRVRSLNDAGESEQVVALIEAALIGGQSQPWMYEVLALSMRAAGRPDADVRRVILSIADFGQATYDGVAQSARYLLSLDQDAAALRLLRQAAAMDPERAEAYLMAMPAVERSGDAEGAMWALPGALRHLWGEDATDARKKAIRLSRSLARALVRAGQEDRAEALRAAVAEAATPDVEVVLTWDGAADLDLRVTDPTGETADFKSRETSGDGRLVTEGFGPSRARERYVCPEGLPGTYAVEVVAADGLPVGGRATLTVVIRQPDGRPRSVERTLEIGDEPARAEFILEAGRRAQPRAVLMEAPKPAARGRMPRVARGGAVARPGDRGAAVGTIVQNVSEGASLTAAAVVSGDRRYVRMGLNPWFASLVDVETFSFIGGP